MAVVFMEGFDNVNETQLVTQKGWSTFQNSAAMQGGRFGGQSGSCGNSYKGHALPGTYTTLYVGFAILWTAINSDTTIYLQPGAFSPFSNGIRMQIVTNAGNQVLKMINNAGTQLGNIGTTIIVANTWYHIQIKLVVHSSAGTIELRLNGSTTPEIVGTSLDTGSSGIVSFGWGAQSQGARLDDLWVVDTTGSAPTNTWLGDTRIETIMPTVEGANTAWTANTGTKVSRVNDSGAFDGDTGFIYSNTLGDRQTFTLSDVGTVTGTVYAVQTNLIARKDLTAFRSIAPVLRIGSTNYDGTTTTGLAQGYLSYQQLYDRLDPSGAGWTVSTVNGMEAGVKEVG